MNLLMRYEYLEKHNVEYRMRLKAIREGMSRNLPGVFLVFEISCGFANELWNMLEIRAF